MGKTKLPAHTYQDRPLRFKRESPRLLWFRRLLNFVFRIETHASFEVTQTESVHDPGQCLRCMYETRLGKRRRQK